MRVVLADIDKRELEKAALVLEQAGGHVIPVMTDVGEPESIEALANMSYETFGSVHLLCNNAGITSARDNVTYAWEVPREDWARILRVNLWGVINGCQSFIPRMLASGDEGHILNTASRAGLMQGHPRELLCIRSPSTQLSASPKAFLNS